MPPHSIFSTLFLSYLTTFVAASPLGELMVRRQGRGLECDKPDLQLPDLYNLTRPDPLLPLKYIAIGVGFQNYTCADSQATTIPVSHGAVATLYDPSKFLNNGNLADVPGIVLPMYRVLDKTSGNPFSFRAMGKHYFNQALTPVFDLTAACTASQFYGKKNGSSHAPDSACKGTRDEGAVDWLQLLDNGSSSNGLSIVYRIETAGGKPPANCAGVTSEITVPYAAEYWFFGSK